ncbi:MAG: general secretion pathway protein GspK [Proteobacteria bacterium]|nr:general secretion pathway protein GspK [Pseudomonadota bacterium]MBU1716618.1 general secretion pathway protein GspK [Pseudomonadota bacterium]
MKPRTIQNFIFISKNNQDRIPASKNEGFALVLVIVILLLVSFLAAQLTLQAQTELKIGFNNKSRITGRFLAEAGINLAIFRLLDKPEDPLPEEGFDKFMLGYPYETVLPSGKIEYHAVSESGKINLNSNSTELLQFFLEYQGLEPEQIAIITDSLKDWQDTDNLYHLNGAEKDYYEALNEPYIPRNGAIADPAEFFLIRGTEVLAGRFAADEIFTAHNPGNKINFNSLSPAMLDFIVDGSQEKKEAYHKAQEEHDLLNSVHAKEIMEAGRYALLSRHLSYMIGRNDYYQITAHGWSGVATKTTEETTATNDKKPPGSKVKVLLKKQGNEYRFLGWKEQYL